MVRFFWPTLYLSQFHMVLSSHFTCKSVVFNIDYLAVIINFRGCCCLVRYYNAKAKCIYDVLKDECDATASAIYTNYYVVGQKRWLDTMNCSISE